MDPKEFRDKFDEAKEGERPLEDTLDDVKEHIGRLDREEQVKILEMVSGELEISEREQEDVEWEEENAKIEERQENIEEALESIKKEVDDEVFEAALKGYADF